MTTYSSYIILALVNLMKLSNLLLFGCLLFAGCELKIPVNYKNVTNTETAVSAETTGVKNALSKASKADTLKVYKLFKGFSNYCAETTVTKNNVELFKRFESVRKDFGWTDNGLPELTAFTKENLLDQSFVRKMGDGMMPEVLTADMKSKFSKLYADYAEGARLAYLEKKDAVDSK